MAWQGTQVVGIAIQNSSTSQPQDEESIEKTPKAKQSLKMKNP